MGGKVPTFLVALLILTAGCGQLFQSDDPDASGVSIEASVVSPPDDATVIEYNSSNLEDKPGIKKIVRQRVNSYKNGGRERGPLRPINSTVLEEYRDLETSYIEYRGVVVRLALLQEQKAHRSE